MRLNGAAALISLLAVVVALATTLFVARPIFAGGYDERFSGPTHPTEPGGKKGRGDRNQAPDFVRA